MTARLGAIPKVVGLVALVVCLGSAGKPEQTINVLVYGIGRSSCAHWLASPENEHEGKTWILGYWSGRNVANPKHDVGNNTDADAIFAATKNACNGDPTLPLDAAVNNVFYEFSRRGK